MLIEVIDVIVAGFAAMMEVSIIPTAAGDLTGGVVGKVDAQVVAAVEEPVV